MIIEWYSRKIVSWGLFPEITQFQVVAVITNAVAIEGLPEGALKPRVVSDHGSVNIAAYTKKCIEVQIYPFTVTPTRTGQFLKSV